MIVGSQDWHREPVTEVRDDDDDVPTQPQWRDDDESIQRSNN
jgi:hypothetical protein